MCSFVLIILENEYSRLNNRKIYPILSLHLFPQDLALEFGKDLHVQTSVSSKRERIVLYLRLEKDSPPVSALVLTKPQRWLLRSSAFSQFANKICIWHLQGLLVQAQLSFQNFLQGCLQSTCTSVAHSYFLSGTLLPILVVLLESKAKLFCVLQPHRAVSVFLYPCPCLSSLHLIGLFCLLYPQENFFLYGSGQYIVIVSDSPSFNLLNGIPNLRLWEIIRRFRLLSYSIFILSTGNSLVVYLN